MVVRACVHDESKGGPGEVRSQQAKRRNARQALQHTRMEPPRVLSAQARWMACSVGVVALI